MSITSEPVLEHRRSRRGGRIASVVAGSLLGTCALALMAFGGFALSATHRDGYVDLGHATYHGDGYAVVSEPYDWSTEKFLAGRVGNVRIRVLPSRGTAPAFVGLARPGDLDRYLAGVGYATGHGKSNYRVTYTTHDGTAPSSPPAGAGVWAAQATGTGTLTLRFPAREQRGDRVLVAMNADGSQSIDGRVETAATVPSLDRIGTVTLTGGIVLLAGSALLVIRPLRKGSGRRRATTA